MNKHLKAVVFVSLISQASFLLALNQTPIVDQAATVKQVIVEEKKFSEIIPLASIEEKIGELAQKINQDYQNIEKPIVFIGVLGGATFFLTSLMQKVTVPCEMEFLKVSSYNGLTSSGIITLQFDSTASAARQQLAWNLCV